MLRRDFLRRSTRTFAATLLTRSAIARAALLEPDPLPQKFPAQDEVILGKTGIRTSRLAMGTGTIGFGGSSNQTRLGSNPSHPSPPRRLQRQRPPLLRHRRLLRQPSQRRARPQALPRDKVVVMTKSDTRDPAGVRADLDRLPP